jgi:formylglycine-generating enzyme required for sulfatase activity
MRRFPGINPFQTDEQDRFFGRDRDIRELYALIALEKTVVVFGKSGHGKSSLLNAGIVPRLLAEKTGSERRYEPLVIKFGAWVQGRTAPAECARTSIVSSFKPGPDAEQLLPGSGDGDDSLWYTLKRSGQKRVALIFDQFEEFFTYPLPQQERFADELSQLLHGDLPPELAERFGSLPEATQDFLADRLDVKAVFAIREDRLHLLDKMQYPLPAIFARRYALHPLPRAQAQEALVLPAALVGFETPAFGFSPEALDKILDYLADKEGRVETNQLQILAESFEKRAEQEGVAQFTPGNLGALKTIVKDYYLEKINALPGAADRLAARKLCEEGLAQEGDPPVRLNLHEAQIQKFYGIGAGLLETLVKNRLLRAEPGAGGGYTYELPHDTLLEPVLELKRERVELEQRDERARVLAEEETRIAAEKAAAERQRRRALLTSLVAGALVLAAVVAMWFAFLQSQKAAAATLKADKKTREAAVSDSLAQIRTKEASSEKQKADDATRRALEAKNDADEKTKLAAAAQSAATLAERKAQDAIKQSGIDSENARVAKLEAVQKKKEADDASHTAELATKEATRLTQQVVTNLLAQSRAAILQLDYDAAFGILVNAASLDAVRDSVAFELMEIAFFLQHAGQAKLVKVSFGLTAKVSLNLAAELLGKPALGEKSDLESALHDLHPGRDSFLRSRYFPVMIDLKGGTYNMQDKYETTVQAFKMAQTETTVWQYNLFCAAKGRKIAQRIGEDGVSIQDNKYQPSWGWIGSHPVVYVHWYDAVEYANWLSLKMGLNPAYDIKPAEKDTTDNKSEYDDFKWTVVPLENANGFRLPAEIEWEYAARGGIRRDTFSYSGSTDIGEVAWYKANSDSHTHAVAGKKANGVGLFDMSGNVWEWCYDWYGALPAETALGSKSGSSRVLRGGSWLNFDGGCHVAARPRYVGVSRDSGHGFRVARH